MTDINDIDAEEMRSIGNHIAAAKELVARHQERHPDHADWRVSELQYRLGRCAVLACYLRDGIDPEGDGAKAGLMERLGYGPEDCT